VRPRTCPQLIGRTRELSAVAAALDAVGEGRGSCIFVVGEPGIGKTRLAGEAAAEAQRRGLPVLSGRATATGAGMPYQSLAAAVLHGLRTQPKVDLSAARGVRAGLATLLPGLFDGPGFPPSPVLIGETVLRVTELLGDGEGALILLDDLQWACGDTLAVIEYLADHAVLAPVVLLATTPVEGAAPELILLDETIVSSSFRVAHAIAAGRTGDSARASALFAEADAGLAGASWLRAVYRRYTAESALSDGWGEPGVWLADAERYFDATGRETLARACRSLLRLAGKSPRRTPSNLYGGGYADLELTTREGDVLALLAGGLTNKQIAARLYLSPRTVEKHVERILTKTGQGNRTALAAYAAGRRSGGGAPVEHTGRRDRSHVDPDVRPALTSRP
jgi:DNA-binding NarL/FixJ family response regulator